MTLQRAPGPAAPSNTVEADNMASKHESQMGMDVRHVQWCSVNSVRAQLWMTYLTINEMPVIHNKDTWKRVAPWNMTRMRSSASTNAKTPCYI